MTTAQLSRPSAQSLAHGHERRLYMASHPVLYTLANLCARLGPIVSVPRLGHLVSDLPLVREVLSTPERFSKTGPGALSDALTVVTGPKALLNMDGEDHRHLKSKLQALFTPAFVADVIRRVLADQLVTLGEQLRRGDRVDLVRESQVMTGRIACSILGLPLPPGREAESCLEMYRTGSELASVLALTRRALDTTRAARARERFATLTQAARKAYDSGDEHCVPGRLRSLGLDFDECRGVTGVLFVASTETTTSALPRIVALLVDTGQWTTLRNRRELLPAAIDEGLRLTSAVPVVTRNVVAPTRLGRRELGTNERVIVLLFKALCSEAMVDNPFTFDIERDRSSHQGPTWFGFGPHFCLGAALARRELEVALTVLLDAGDLSIVARRHAGSGLMPGYGSLEIARLT